MLSPFYIVLFFVVCSVVLTRKFCTYFLPSCVQFSDTYFYSYKSVTLRTSDPSDKRTFGLVECYRRGRRRMFWKVLSAFTSASDCFNQKVAWLKTRKLPVSNMVKWHMCMVYGLPYSKGSLGQVFSLLENLQNIYCHCSASSVCSISNMQSWRTTLLFPHRFVCICAAPQLLKWREIRWVNTG